MSLRCFIRLPLISTLAEKLRQKDAQVARALEAKQQLIAEILEIPPGEFAGRAPGVAGGGGVSVENVGKTATELLLATLNQG